MICHLSYIPTHLHTNDNPIIEEFSLGEKLFYRCLPQNITKPYDNIKLKDISHNRNFKNDELFGNDCVFYNILENDAQERYENLNYITILIKELQGNYTYIKEINKTNNLNEAFKVVITLKHSPEPCMYPHSVFEIVLNGVVLNGDNYKKTLGKDNVFFSNLRYEIRQELTSIIQTGFIDTSNEIEIITEP